MIFCTLFNWRYLPQGIALYWSLERATKGDFTLHVLCIDDYTLAALRSLRLPKVRIIPISEIEDDMLRALREMRSIGEFCWTCTTPLLIYVLAQQPPDAVVAYVDADLWFDADPRAVLDEMGKGSIFIHEHDFAPERDQMAASAGRFNVGLVAFRNDAEGRACLERWKIQCMDECVMDPAAGKCGDQNYLDEWPERYRGLVISRNPGVGLAPWNVEKHQVKTKHGHILVDDRPMVFYHFHSLTMLRPRLRVFRPVVMAYGYNFDQDLIDMIYVPYVRELWRASRILKRARYGIEEAVQSLPVVSTRTRAREILLQISGYSIPVAHNPTMLGMLYGIDRKHEML
jgi:hypothetical protein